MRTTLTLDDDLAASLKERARATGRSFKSVVNEVIRRGLSAGEGPLPELEPFSVQPHSCGFRPGVDTGKLNQLSTSWSPVPATSTCSNPFWPQRAHPDGS